MARRIARRGTARHFLRHNLEQTRNYIKDDVLLITSIGEGISNPKGFGGVKNEEGTELKLVQSWSQGLMVQQLHYFLNKSRFQLNQKMKVQAVKYYSSVEINFNLTAVLKRGWRFQQQLRALGQWDLICIPCRNSSKLPSPENDNDKSNYLNSSKINAGNRPTTHLNSKGWENVIALFQVKTQKNYGKPQLKNKWDTIKKEWRLWRELLKESTATGENAWAPSSGVLPSGVPMGDDTPNEGFGDSDEHSNENEGIPPNEVP
ncbi:hypothetical protein GOBAR_AA32758 [Gossypium barbadense]|uniref:Myb/SANT-like domain-containing protein n=1 Tax=Gossypium barbadense TaxID=3634 RepID=A0A2P5WA25_GOSBA|nr:hypothetical protein GOBAR_AA32758 [Gossypium barbadense]